MSARLQVVLLARGAGDEGLRGRARLVAQSALARRALGLSAMRSGAVLGALKKDEEEAPLPSAGWHWSLSHAQGFAGGVVCRGRVGLDVEAVAERSEDVVGRVCSGDELRVMGGFSWEKFARVWTAKEAVLKLAGVGLLELDRCRVMDAVGASTLIVEHRRVRRVVRQDMREEHVAAVVWDGAERDVEWIWTSELTGAPEQRQPVPSQRRGYGRLPEQPRSTGVVRVGRLDRADSRLVGDAALEVAAGEVGAAGDRDGGGRGGEA